MRGASCFGDALGAVSTCGDVLECEQPRASGKIKNSPDMFLRFMAFLLRSWATPRKRSSLAEPYRRRVLMILNGKDPRFRQRSFCWRGSKRRTTLAQPKSSRRSQMRTFFTILVAGSAAAFLVGGCSSDSDSGAGSAGDGQCHGDYAALTQSQLDAKLDSAGKCAGGSDSVAICGSDVTTTAEQCGADCYKNQAPDDATQDTCVKTCISGSVALSAGCLECYITDVACARDHCLLQCGLDATGEACYECRVKNGCASGFFGCSGLPNEAGAGNAAGAGGEDEAAGGAAGSASLAGAGGA